MNRYYVYIMTNRVGSFYTGITSNLIRRVDDHKQNRVKGYPRRDKINRLVYYEESPEVGQAILREKQLKRWYRDQKIMLIRSANPEWKDLSEEISDYRH